MCIATKWRPGYVVSFASTLTEASTHICTVHDCMYQQYSVLHVASAHVMQQLRTYSFVQDYDYT